nr:DUF554 domain-containing protein [Corynebacterium lactis]
MIGLGTLINVAGIIAGGVFGVAVGHRLSARMQETLLAATGMSVIGLALAGMLSKMFTVTGGRIEAGGTIMLVVSLAAGAVIGELIDLDGAIVRFGHWLQVKSRSSGDALFVTAFVNASVTVAVGAMAILGAIEDGLGDPSILIAKALLDAIIIAVMAAAQGRGCIFSAIPVAIFQGVFTVVGFLGGAALPQPALDNLSLVGSLLIACVGLNIIRERRFASPTCSLPWSSRPSGGCSSFRRGF